MNRPMNRLIGRLHILLAMVGLVVLTACEETTGEVDHTYDRWQARNDSAFHSIYTHAQQQIEAGSSEWRIIKNYATTLAPSERNSIVVRIAHEGTGSGCPMYTDSARINYRGMLINGETFDHSGFYPDSASIFSPDFCRPTNFLVSNTVEGFTTALQHMHIGDQWRVYIPQQLGYGKQSQGKVRSYSTLVFDLQLLQYARTGNALPAW